LNPIALLIAIVLLPLAAALASAVLTVMDQRQQAKPLAGLIGTAAMALSFVSTLFLLVGYDAQASFKAVHPWLALPGMPVLAVGFYADAAARAMVTLVTFIALLVHVYSLAYMKKDPHQGRYFAYLALFCCAMLALVLSPNLVQLYVFWELVGITSYLLIGFWHHWDVAARASLKAFVVNRIGDALMLGGILLLLHDGVPTDFFTQPQAALTGAHTWAALLVFCGAVGKSAQAPLHVWLPDAMTGPTPVSALIHAATMVAAGVFLLFRIFPLLTPMALAVVAVVGALTAFIGAVGALSQWDIKRVLAYSTLSQLGYMVMGMGLGAPQAGMLHLVTHAFFKCALFLIAGIVIKAIYEAGSKHDAQDMRLMGGLARTSPGLAWAYGIAAAALVGVPFTSGALSKDLLLEHAVALAVGQGGVYALVGVLAFATVLLTAYYTTRQGLLVFYGDNRDGLALQRKPPAARMIVPVYVLAALSVWVGFAWSPFAAGSWVMGWFGAGNAPAGSYHLVVSIATVALIGMGIFAAWRQYRADKFLSATLQNRWWSRLSANGVYADAFYQWAIVNNLHRVAALGAAIDRLVLDGIIHLLWRMVAGKRLDNRWSLAAIAAWADHRLVDGTVRLAGSATLVGGRLLQMLQTGRLQTYLLLTVFAVVLLLLYLVL
jgi:NADH-quinone oxidoreductase subunit L